MRVRDREAAASRIVPGETGARARVSCLWQLCYVWQLCALRLGLDEPKAVPKWVHTLDLAEQ